MYSTSNIQNEDPSFNFASNGSTNIKVPTSVQYVKVPNLVMSTSNIQPTSFPTKLQNIHVKDEPPESPSNKASMTYQQNFHSSDNKCLKEQACNVAATETTEIKEQENCDKTKNSQEESSDQENKEFVLAPTPAQLGKAPLQRRQNTGIIVIG